MLKQIAIMINCDEPTEENENTTDIAESCSLWGWELQNRKKWGKAVFCFDFPFLFCTKIYLMPFDVKYYLLIYNKYFVKSHCILWVILIHLCKSIVYVVKRSTRKIIKMLSVIYLWIRQDSTWYVLLFYFMLFELFDITTYIFL